MNMTKIGQSRQENFFFQKSADVIFTKSLEASLMQKKANPMVVNMRIRILG